MTSRSVLPQARLGSKLDGTLWAWGRGDHGQLGDGNLIALASPTLVGQDRDWVAVSAGTQYSVGLKKNGTLWSWGGNWAGQLGNGTTRPLHTLFGAPAPRDEYTGMEIEPRRVGADSDWVAVSAGCEHVLALKKDGTLWTWGRNNQGQLGDGTTVHRSVPKRVGEDTDWAVVEADGGGMGGPSVALKRDGTLWLWGDGYRARTAGRTPQQPGGVALSRPARIGTDRNWVRIAAGRNHLIAIKADGSLWGLGLDYTNQQSSGTQFFESPVRITGEAGWRLAALEGVGYKGRMEFNAYAIKQDGSLWTWGRAIRPIGNVPPGSPSANPAFVMKLGFFGDSPATPTQLESESIVPLKQKP